VRKLVIPAVLAVALVVPAQATAKTKHYVGAVSPSGSIAFNLKITKRKGKKPQKSIRGFSFAGIPVTCAEGAKTTHGVVSFPVKLKGGNFKIFASSNVTGATLRVHGSLSTGTLHVAGNVPVDPSGQGTNCDSGVLTWTAHRG
jgi:hypothetical protein